MKILILQDKADYFEGRDWPRGVCTRGLHAAAEEMRQYNRTRNSRTRPELPHEDKEAA